ncbi:MAG: glycosyltransferase [Chloroflexota bacterium]
MGRILLTSVGTAGDIIPFVLLGKALQQRGHHVILLTHCAYRGECERAGLSFVSLDTPAEFEGFIQDGHWLNTGPGITQFLRRYVIPSIAARVEIIRANCTADSVIVARSTPSIAARLAAEAMRLPFVSMLMAPQHITALTTVAALSETVFSNEINAIRTAMGISQVCDWHAWWQAASLNLGLWPAWFSPLPERMPVETVLAGFLWHSEVQGLELLHPIVGAVPPVLITGGTGMFGGKEFLDACAKACGLLGWPALLLTRVAALCPENLPENVRWVEYIPALDVFMRRVKVVVHHGGMGTLHGALAAGVPQVILAAGGDRPDNAFHAARLGVAEFLPRPRWDVPLVAQAIERVSDSAAVAQRCREVAGWFRHTDALTVACDAVEAVVASGRPYCGAGLADGRECSPVQVEDASASSAAAKLTDLTPEARALLTARLRQRKQSSQPPERS